MSALAQSRVPNVRHAANRTPKRVVGTLALAFLFATACRTAHDSGEATPATATPIAQEQHAEPVQRSELQHVASQPSASQPSESAQHDATAKHAEPRVVRITAKRFEYAPSSIELKKGMPIVLELVSLDRVHGFNAPDFGLRSDVKPDEVTRLSFTPQKSGTFEFHCDVFCGGGHEDMTGEFVVRE